METTTVKVRIYGQDYTISGERDEETIRAIADYVNEKMREIAKFFSSNQPGSLATLAAVNICDELFDKRDEAAKLKASNDELSTEVKHYIEMWEDAKKSFAQYKDGVSKAGDEVKAAEAKIKELQDKLDEYESAYFDLQMENIQLKSRLGRQE